MNFYYDINLGIFLNIWFYRVDGFFLNYIYIVCIYVNFYNIILIMYVYLCVFLLNYIYIVCIFVCIYIKL